MTLKAMANAVVALVAITLTSLITGAAKVDGQIPENGQNLNASEIDRSTTIEEEEEKDVISLDKGIRDGFR